MFLRSFQFNFWGLLGWGTLMLSLSGCLSNPTEPTLGLKSQPVINESDPVLVLPEMPPQHASKLTGQTMYQILVAEMMVQRHHPAEAYQLIMPLAKKLQDKGLAERAFELSMTTYNVNEIKKSAKLLQKVDPQNASGWKASYLLSAAQGHTDEAVKEWEMYLKVSKVSFDRQVVLTTKRIVKTVEPKSGMAFISALYHRYHDQPAMIYAMGLAAYSYQHYEQAKALFWQAEALYSPDNHPARYSDIHAYLSGCYLALDQAKEGLKKLRPYLEAFPKDWDFQQNYARLEVSAGQLTAAQKRFENILKHQPNSNEVKLALSLLLLESRQFSKADQLLHEMATSADYQSAANYYLGMSSKAQQKPKLALSYFEKVKTGLYAAKARINQSELIYDQEGIEAANQFLDKQIKKYQKFPRVLAKLWEVKGLLSRNAKQPKAAMKAYQQALKYDDQNVGTMFALSVLYYDDKQFNRYVDLLKQVLAINPNQVDALNALGYYYLIEGHDLDKAKTYINQAVEKAPNTYYILDSKGWLLYVQKDFKGAKVILEEALKLQLDDEVLIHLIKTLWALDEKDEATRLWQKYHGKFPDNNHLQKLMQTLQTG